MNGLPESVAYGEFAAVQNITVGNMQRIEKNGGKSSNVDGKEWSVELRTGN